MNRVRSAFWLTTVFMILAADSVCAQQHRVVTLRDVLNDVLTSHPALRAADARVRAARGGRATAGRFENPMLAYQVENAALPGRSAPPMDREVMTMAVLPLNSLYQRWPRVRRGDAEVAASESEALMQRQQIGMGAARAFYRTALAQVGLEAARDLVIWLDTIVVYNRIRVNEGVAAEADLIRSELERDRAGAEEALQAAELAMARAELRGFLDGSMPVMVAFDTTVFALPNATEVDDSVLIGNRPDVRAAHRRRAAAQAGVAVEKSMVIGEVDATLGVKRSAGTTSLVAGASLPFPLFNLNRGEIARASAEEDAAAFETVAVERVARAELAAAREAAGLLTERATALSTGFLGRADLARRITLGAYREGAVQLLHVIDASRAWGEARRAYHQLLFAQHESVLALLIAQGQQLSRFFSPQDR